MPAIEGLYKGEQHSSGVVLLLAMIFLLLLSVLAGTTMRSSILELRMSGNQLFKAEASQAAVALASSISNADGNFPIDLPVNYALCKKNDTSPYCIPGKSIAVSPSAAYNVGRSEVTYKVERMGPTLLQRLPQRIAQHSVSSNLAFRVAIFEVQVGINGQATGLGHAQVIHGVAKLVAAPPGMSAE